MDSFYFILRRLLNENQTNNAMRLKRWIKNKQNGPCTQNAQALLNDFYCDSNEPCLENAMYALQMNKK